MKRILCALLLCGLLCALLPAAFADGQVQTVTLNIPCNVTVDVGEHGKVYSIGTTYPGKTVGSFQVWPGTNVPFLITPDTGYAVSVLTLSGKDVREGLRYGVYSTVITRDETLLVRFEKSTTPTVTPTPSPWSTPVTTTPPWKVTPPYGPKTADESHVGIWAAALLVSAAPFPLLSRKLRVPRADKARKRS